MNQSKLEKIVFKLVTGKVEKFEPIFIVLVVGVLFLNMLDSVVVQPITVIVLSSIALLYIMTAYKDHSESELTLIDIFYFKIGAFSSAVALIGTQFNLMGFPGNKMMLVTGAASLLGVLIYILAKGKVEKFGTWTVLRMAVLAIIAGGIFLGMVI